MSHASQRASIDPYGLLGVTYKSSLTDVRRAYYELALVVHPDKGGSAEDMGVLESSYKWIRDQLMVANSNSKTAEEAEKEFADFLAAQELARPPTVSAVFAESIGFTRDIFDSLLAAMPTTTMPPDVLYEHVLLHLHLRSAEGNSDDGMLDCAKEFMAKDVSAGMVWASVQHGYGADMTTASDEEVVVRPFGKQEVVTYTEPESFFKPSATLGAVDTSSVTRMDDYTTSTAKLYMTDYKQAFKESESSAFAELFEDNNSSLDVLLAARRLDRL